MFYVIFETSIPPTGRALSSQYYTKLQGLVGGTPGFIAETGYASTPDEGARLLFVRFQDEESAHKWRRHPVHLSIQWKARHDIYTDYRLRVGPELRFDIDIGSGGEHTDGNGILLILEHGLNDNASSEVIDRILSGVPQSGGKVGTYVNTNTMIHLIPRQDVASAHGLVQAFISKTGIAVYCMDIIREYGNTNRKQAPLDAVELQTKCAGLDIA